MEILAHKKFTQAFISLTKKEDDEVSQKLAEKTLNTFGERYANMHTADRNRKIMREISGTVATLNKSFFQKKFEEYDFEHRHYLKQSNEYVK